MARQDWGLTLRVAATFMGTVVGAGFASGQETMKFFSAFGKGGLWGIALATALLCLYGVLILDLGRRLRAHSHREVLEYACGPHLGAVLDLTVTLFLFAALAVMLAGSGALVAEQLGLPAAFGTWITVVLTAGTVLAGMPGILAANSIVVPLLTLFVLGLSIASLEYHGLRSLPLNPAPSLAAAPNWFVSAWLYAAYNLILSISVLSPLGAQVEDRRVLIWGGILGGLGLGVLGAAIKLAIAVHLPQISQFQVPMLFLARLHSLPVQVFYTLVLWAEIYTTAISSAFGFSQRTAEFSGVNYRWVVFFTMLLAAAGSQVGFSQLVGTLYPAFGYASMFFLLFLTWRVLQGEK